MPTRWQIERGADVYGADGSRIGQVADAMPDYIHVVKGYIFHKDMYLPTTLVAEVNDGVVRLSVDKDRARELATEQPPAARTGTAETAATEARSFGHAEERREAAHEVRVPISEEELVARKHSEEVGEVEVHKDVIEEERTFRVPVSREEVHVERIETDRPLRPGEKAFVEETIRIPIVEEEVTAEKRAHVVGEVVVSKEVVEEQREVKGTVRHEEVRVERIDERHWEKAEPQFRAHYEQTGVPGRWSDVEPAYRFGHATAYDRRYQARTFAEAEPDLRQEWEARGGRTPWAEVRTKVHDAWHRVRGTTPK
ncbi:DUF2382 domain-containing protein [Myxococcota bacterium]|nr:DUF2382 domain-containing protein [Myxococcota bacterium]